MGQLDLMVADGVATLSINNPARHNAMDTAMWTAMPDRLAEAAHSPDARVLVLRGAGGRAFCSGNDITEFDSQRASPEAADIYNARQRRVQQALYDFPKPIIAAIEGHCLGAGFEFALQSDLRFCTAAARFGVPAVALGLPYRAEDIQKLLEVMPAPLAREMVLTAQPVPGEAAAANGLVHRCLPDAEALFAHVAQVASRMAGHAPLALAAAKAGFRELLRRDASPDFARCEALAATAYGSADYAEGRAAFREKRKPRFTGR
jgi:enoyl-CoA hydratase/carnithine racemase